MDVNIFNYKFPEEEIDKHIKILKEACTDSMKDMDLSNIMHKISLKKCMMDLAEVNLHTLKNFYYQKIWEYI